MVKKPNWLVRLYRSSIGMAPDPERETGEQNAQRFVRTVATLARDDRVIICYPHGIPSPNNRRVGWQWMLNPKWRERVLELLKDAPVRGADFSPPDSMDGWTFVAYSTVPVPRIAQLELDQAL
jgi:hypothetical protein